jgi:hypothetical protein
MRADRKKELFLVAYVANGCHVTKGCEAAGICRDLYYKWMSLDKQFVTDVYNAKQSLIDHVEGKVINLINKDDKEMIRWFLEHKAKDRGWAPDKAQQEHTGTIEVKIIREPNDALIKAITKTPGI